MGEGGTERGRESENREVYLSMFKHDTRVDWVSVVGLLR